MIRIAAITVLLALGGSAPGRPGIDGWWTGTIGGGTVGNAAIGGGAYTVTSAGRIYLDDIRVTKP